MTEARLDKAAREALKDFSRKAPRDAIRAAMEKLIRDMAADAERGDSGVAYWILVWAGLEEGEETPADVAGKEA